MAVLSLSLPFDASAAELTAATRRAWQRYVAATEARIERELHTPGCFLSLDFDAPADRRRARAALRDGTVMVTNLQGETGAGVDLPSGTINHWRGVVFIPGATVDEVLLAVSDPTGARAHRQEDVVDARVLSRSTGGLRLFLKLQRRGIVSVAYNTEHDVAYRTHGSGPRQQPQRGDQNRGGGQSRRARRVRAAGGRRSRFSLGFELVLAL